MMKKLFILTMLCMTLMSCAHETFKATSKVFCSQQGDNKWGKWVTLPASPMTIQVGREMIIVENAAQDTFHLQPVIIDRWLGMHISTGENFGAFVYKAKHQNKDVKVTIYKTSKGIETIEVLDGRNQYAWVKEKF